MNQTALKYTTKQFVLALIQFVSALPYPIVNRIVNRNMGYQLLRSETWVSANYRAACKARSKAELTAKPQTCVEEADEPIHCIKLFVEWKIANNKEVFGKQTLANGLASIFVAFIKMLKQSQSVKL
jgi:four helix bundle protein